MEQRVSGNINLLELKVFRIAPTGKRGAVFKKGKRMNQCGETFDRIIEQCRLKFRGDR